MNVPEQAWKQAAAHIANADALLITAGAGMGVDSGLPDFRSSGGLWKTRDFAGESFVDLASGDRFLTDAGKAWGFYGYRQKLYRDTPPHAGYEVLLRWANSRRDGYFVFTSNVDGHFQTAGFSDDKIVECHGAIETYQCARPCWDELWPARGIDFEIDPERMRASGDLPSCQNCGGMARPNILMFSDGAWLSSRTHEQQERMQSWVSRLFGRKVVIVEVGAGGVIPTVRWTGREMAETLEAVLVSINPADPQELPGGVPLRCTALDALKRLDAAVSRMTDR